MYSRRSRSTRTATTTQAPARTTRGRTNKAKGNARRGGNPDTARVRASIEKPPVVPWVKVMRPPSLYLKNTFLVEKWVRPSDLTEAERSVFENEQRKQQEERKRWADLQREKREAREKERKEEEERKREKEAAQVNEGAIPNESSVGVTPPIATSTEGGNSASSAPTVPVHDQSQSALPSMQASVLAPTELKTGALGGSESMGVTPVSESETKGQEQTNSTTLTKMNENGTELPNDKHQKEEIDNQPKPPTTEPEPATKKIRLE